MFYSWLGGLGQGGKTEEKGVPVTDRKQERPQRAAATGILLFQ